MSFIFLTKYIGGFMSKKAAILLVISGLFTLAIGLSNVFVNIFLWKQTNDFIVIAKYNLMHHLLIPFGFLIGGWLSKKKSGTWPLRIGIGFFILFFLFILLVKDKMEYFIYPLGILFGTATGFYWLGFEVLSFDFTSILNRDTFNGYNGCIFGISSAIAPFTASYIIESSNQSKGYTIVFIISLLIFVFLILVSFLLKNNHYGEKLVFKKIIGNNNRDWSYLRKGLIAWGLRDMVIIFVVDVLIYRTTNSEATLGKLYLISYSLSSIAHILEQKLIKPKRRLASIHIGTIFIFLAAFSLFIGINYTSILIYIVLSAIFTPFFFVPMTSATFNILTLNNEENMRTEYIINRNIALSIGRISSIVMFMTLLKFSSNIRAINYFLLLIGSVPFISLYFFRKFKRWQE